MVLFIEIDSTQPKKPQLLFRWIVTYLFVGFKAQQQATPSNLAAPR